MQKELQELVQKAVQSFGGQIIGQGLYCIMVILFGRFLGAEIYGEYIYVYTFLSIFTIFVKLGMEHTIIYYVSRNDVEKCFKRSVVRFAFLAVIILGTIITILGWTFHDWITLYLLNSDSYGNLLVVLFPMVILDAIADLLFSTLRGKKLIWEMTFAQNIVGAIVRINLFLIMCIGLKIRDPICIIFPQYIGSFVAIIYCLFMIRKKANVKEANAQLSFSQYKDILRYSLPLLFMNGVVLINHNADKYMIGFLMGDTYVAIYTVAVYIGNFSSFALSAVNSIFAPMISELYAKGKIQELDGLYKKATRWVMIINLAIFSMIINFPDEIMRLAGGDFKNSGSILIVVMLGQIVNSGVGAVGYLNSMTGHTKVNLFTSLVAVSVNLLLNILLIGSFGMLGAAIASAVSMALSNILNLWYVYKNVKVFPYTKRYLGVLSAFIISTLLIYIIFHNSKIFYFSKLLFGGLIFVILYFVMCYMWALEIEEKEWINKKLKTMMERNKR